MLIGEIHAPIDEQTGIPYPIMPRTDLPLVNMSLDNNGICIADWHHSFHPRESLSQGTPAQIALRNSRVQWVSREDHNTYHLNFVGPKPLKEEQILPTVLFAVAGHIPDRVINFRPDRKAYFSAITQSQRHALWRGQQVKVANQITVRDYLVSEALKHDFEGINGRTIDEFLNTDNLQRRTELGYTLLGLAIYDSVNPLQKSYRQAREAQLMMPGSARHIGRLALGIVGGSHRNRALKALELHLRAS